MSYNDNYYFTFEEFLGLLSIAYEDAHGKQDTGIRCHPEDLYKVSDEKTWRDLASVAYNAMMRQTLTMHMERYGSAQLQ
jgi:hypothetical protein